MINHKKIFYFFVLFFTNFISAIIVKPKVLLIMGTRPEAIKMIPVYNALKKKNFDPIICSTGQHIEMVNEIFDFFKIKPDFELNIMKPKQDLFYITTEVLNKLKNILLEVKPSLVLVQGDTTSAMAGAMSAFYLKIPIGHIEAGLRTNDINSPFPEEMNRRFISLVTNYHFAPTERAHKQLLTEGIKSESIFNTGNTVVDALYSVTAKIENKEVTISENLKNYLTRAKEENKKIILLTIHRRESLHLFENIFSAVKEFAQNNPNTFIIYPVHPNPVIKDTIIKIGIDKIENIVITYPIIYKDMVYVLNNVDAVATDSGGIQEEAISLGKPTLVLRLETERSEGIIAGVATLVKNFNKEDLKQELEKLIKTFRTNKQYNVYGDGTASYKIVDIIAQQLL